MHDAYAIMCRDFRSGTKLHYIFNLISTDLRWNSDLIIIMIPSRAIFNQVSKITQDCFGFALPPSVIGPKNLRAFLTNKKQN